MLFQINLMSKSMQRMDMDLMMKCEEFLKDYVDFDFAMAITTVKEITETLDIDPVFHKAPCRKKERHFYMKQKMKPLLILKSTSKPQYFIH